MGEPRYVVFDKEKEKADMEKHAKAVVKYLDPENPWVKNTRALNATLKHVDREWVEKNGPAWLERYDKVTTPKLNSENFISSKLKRLKLKN